MMLRVRFKGEEYLLTNGDLNEGPLATAEQFAHGLPSFAHLFPDGVIKRYGSAIGRKEDLEVLTEVEDIEPSDDGWQNLFSDAWLK